VAFYASLRGTYLVGIARRAGSADARFELTALPAEPPAQPPGNVLPRDGVRAALNAVLDPSDAWSVDMTRGSTYRFNVSSRACVAMALYRPGIYSFATALPVLAADCGRYETFT